MTYRLPTEQEWEKAAGWDPVEEKLYTYGYHQEIYGCEWMNFYFSGYCYGEPLPVGSFDGTNGKQDAKSFYGCYDMSGNVWEWTTGINSSNRVVRGSDWNNPWSYCTVTYRAHAYVPSLRGDSIGFRLVLDLN